MPVARISLIETDLRDLIELRFDLLQADDVGLFGRKPLRELLAPRADSVHVPGGDSHGPAIVKAAPGNTSEVCMRKVLFIGLLVLLPASSLFAQDWRGRRGYERARGDNQIELTPFGGYRYGGTIFADTNDLFSQNVDVKS